MITYLSDIPDLEFHVDPHLKWKANVAQQMIEHIHVRQLLLKHQKHQKINELLAIQ